MSTCRKVRLSLLVLFLPFCLLAHGESSPGAWGLLMKNAPEKALELSAHEAEALHLMTAEQVRAFVDGADASQILLKNGKTLEEILERESVGEIFDLSWFSIDGGSSLKSKGGEYSVVGTVGQPDVGLLSGGTFRLAGGFLAITQSIGTCSGQEAIFCDGFESGDISRWNSSSK